MLNSSSVHWAKTELELLINSPLFFLSWVQSQFLFKKGGTGDFRCHDTQNCVVSSLFSIWHSPVSLIWLQNLFKKFNSKLSSSWSNELYLFSFRWKLRNCWKPCLCWPLKLTPCWILKWVRPIWPTVLSTLHLCSSSETWLDCLHATTTGSSICSVTPLFSLLLPKIEIK